MRQLLSAQGAISSLRLRVIEVYARLCARSRFFYFFYFSLSPRGTTFFIWKISLRAAAQRDSRPGLGAHCEGMNDVAIIAAVLCCAAEDGGPRNEEAFNEIICAPSAVCAARRLRWNFAPRPEVFNIYPSHKVLIREGAEGENLLDKCKRARWNWEKSWNLNTLRGKKQNIFHYIESRAKFIIISKRCIDV